MNYPSDSYQKMANLRIRPVDEWDHCMVYTPANPQLVMLNLDAWLIVELYGEGNTVSAVTEAYCSSGGNQSLPRDPSEKIIEATKKLVSLGILQVAPGAS